MRHERARCRRAHAHTLQRQVVFSASVRHGQRRGMVQCHAIYRQQRMRVSASYDTQCCRVWSAAEAERLEAKSQGGSMPPRQPVEANRGRQVEFSSCRTPTALVTHVTDILRARRE